MKIAINSFKGTVPVVQPRLLATPYAQTSVNVKYDSGSLVPYNACAQVQSISDSTSLKTIHKYALSSTTSRWLRFSTNVFLVNDPIFADTNNRMVISNLDAPRIFDITTLGSDTTVDATNSYLLGLTSPAQPTIAVGGSGSGTPETRSYVIQYDRHWSDSKIDAGPWSLPGVTSGGALTVDVEPGKYVTVSNIADAPAGYGITHITVNRSASSTTATAYQYVFTFNIAAAKAGTVSGVSWNSGTSKFTYTDSVATAALGAEVFNQDYIAPPSTLSGVISLGNGILAGYSNNYIYFSEPYQCHAWPDKYRIAIDRTVVGLGSFGSTLVVCTDSEPELITVSDPASAVSIPVKEVAPCVSKYAIVSFRDAVVYPSYEGFIRIDSAGIANITQSIASSSDISAYIVPDMSAVGLDGVYYGIFKDVNNQKKILVINMVSPDQGLGFIDTAVDCAYIDRQTSTIYVAYAPTRFTYAIGSIDKDTTTPLKFQWKSKVFTTEDDTVNMSAARIRFKAGTADAVASIPNATIPSNINSTFFNEEPINGYAYSNANTLADTIVFKMFADGDLILTKNVTSTRPFRLPSGYVASTFEFELSGYSTVYEVDIATSMSELVQEG